MDNMTAVNLLQLKKQINALLWTFMDPEAFRRDLKKLIEQYSNLSYKPGKGAVSSIQSSELHVPPLVLRALELDLYQTVREHPQAALNNCDSLWKDPNNEMHIVAFKMLGNIPLDHQQGVFQRIEQWAKEPSEVYSEKTILLNATLTVRRNEPDKLLEKAKEWCQSQNLSYQSIGLKTLIILAEEPSYINLPGIFHTLEGILPETPAVLQSELFDLLLVLLQKSEIETVFFIRQKLEQEPSKPIIRTARKLLPYFPESSRQLIQTVLRKNHGS